MAYQTTNPYNGKADKPFSECKPEQLEAKLEAAATCYDSWRATSFSQRKNILTRAASLMRERSEQLAGLITLEMGKPIAESRGEVALSAAIRRARHRSGSLSSSPWRSNS